MAEDSAIVERRQLEVVHREPGARDDAGSVQAVRRVGDAVDRRALIRRSEAENFTVRARDADGYRG